MVSEKNEHKTRRVWIPNVHRKRLWSTYLGRFVRVKVNLRVLRTIDKLGGIDQYLIGSDTPARIKELGVVGWRLRWMVMQTDAYTKRVQDERARLGLPSQGWRAAEHERMNKERKEAVAAAEVYLNALEIDKQQSTRTGGLVEAIQGSSMETDPVRMVPEELQVDPLAEANDTKSEMHEADIESIRGSANETNSAEAGSQHSEDVTTTTAASSEAIATALTNLELLAFKINSSPDALIKQARSLRHVRGPQEAERAARQARAEERADQYTSEIEKALESKIHPAPVAMYEKYLKIHRKDINAKRAERGLRPFSKEKLGKVYGPPEGMPKEAWARLEQRVHEIKLSWQEKSKSAKPMQTLEANESEVKKRSITDVAKPEVQKVSRMESKDEESKAVASVAESVRTNDTKSEQKPTLWERAQGFVGLRK